MYQTLGIQPSKRESGCLPAWSLCSNPHMEQVFSSPCLDEARRRGATCPQTRKEWKSPRLILGLTEGSFSAFREPLSAISLERTDTVTAVVASVQGSEPWCPEHPIPPGLSIGSQLANRLMALLSLSCCEDSSFPPFFPFSLTLIMIPDTEQIS